MDFVIGLDLGTAGSRAVAVAADGRIAAVASAAHPSLLTGDGQVEQDPAHWWESAAGCLREVTRQAGPAPLAVGLSGQMDGPVLLGGDGQVLGTCHIWADSRATAECSQITGLIGAGQLIAVAGKPAVPAYTAPKLLWIKAHESRRFAAARRVLLPKDYLRWRLTGTQATDPSDASNTLLFDVRRRCWSDQLAAAAEPGCDGLTFLPYLAGTRSPEYDPDARGAFTGLSLGHTTGHLVRAVMECVAFAQRESAEVLAGLGVPVRSVVTAGGGARSAVWRGIQAGVFGVPVSYYPAPGGEAPAGPGPAEQPDSSALGAAILAGAGSGLFDSLAGGAALVRAGDPDVIGPEPADVISYQAAFARYRQAARAVAPLRKEP
jgi:sugar (pentulose or hexulose) kinase